MQEANAPIIENKINIDQSNILDDMNTDTNSDGFQPDIVKNRRKYSFPCICGKLFIIKIFGMNIVVAHVLNIN